MQLFQPPFISSEELWPLVYTHKDSDSHVYHYNYLALHNAFFVDCLACRRIVSFGMSMQQSLK